MFTFLDIIMFQTESKRHAFLNSEYAYSSILFLTFSIWHNFL